MPVVTSQALSRSDVFVLAAGGGAVVAAGLAHYTGAAPVLAFVVAGLAVALLASVVGRSVEQLGDRFGAGATGVLQSALGNLPELFIGFFALKAGLVAVVQAAIIGSILSNILLVLGLAFLVGGLRHGVQRFDSDRARTSMILMVLATAALVLPSLAQYVHTPAAGHEQALSLIVSLILLAVFALSLPAALRRTEPTAGAGSGTEVPDAIPDDDMAAGSGAGRWPLWLAVFLLTAASIVAALVSDWFVAALKPAISTLGISQAFAGLVIVAIAGNAIENVVGPVEPVHRNQPDAGVRADARRRGRGDRDRGGVHRFRRRIDVVGRRNHDRALRDHRHRLLVGLSSARSERDRHASIVFVEDEVLERHGPVEAMPSG